jgi:hypothetical protein
MRNAVRYDRIDFALPPETHSVRCLNLPKLQGDIRLRLLFKGEIYSVHSINEIVYYCLVEILDSAAAKY